MHSDKKNPERKLGDIYKERDELYAIDALDDAGLYEIQRNHEDLKNEIEYDVEYSGDGKEKTEYDQDSIIYWRDENQNALTVITRIPHDACRSSNGGDYEERSTYYIYGNNTIVKFISSSCEYVDRRYINNFRCSPEKFREIANEIINNY